ncbi:MAG: polysaccharide deacetylase family protein [Erythrobacter sp.]
MNFHGVGNTRRTLDEGEARYWIEESHFSEMLDVVQSKDMPIAITFDDGNESDWTIAAPQLLERGLSAKFFVLAGKLDQTGYLTRAQVAQLDREPIFTVGSHGSDHLVWPDLDDPELEQEISSSRRVIGDICGREVYETGLPFGRYDRKTLISLKKHGYRRIYSSDGGPRLFEAAPIPRFSITRETSTEELERLIGKFSRFPSRLKNEIRATLKAFR